MLFYHAMLCKRGLCRHAVYVCLSVFVSVTFVNSVKTNKHIKNFSPFQFFRAKWHSNTLTGIPLTRASNAGGVGRNRDSEPISAVNAATSQVLSTRSPVDHGHRTASCDTLLVVSAGVDCGRRRNVYDKKPQCYAKDNRTAFNCTQ